MKRHTREDEYLAGFKECLEKPATLLADVEVRCCGRGGGGGAGDERERARETARQRDVDRQRQMQQ